MNIVMMATMAPYDIRNPPTPSSWARLLGLPPDSGPRRINYNLKLIEEQGLITLTPRPARPPLIKLRDPRPGSQAYSPRKGRYVGIPIEFWTQGWILELPPTAIALLLVLEDVTGGYTGPRYVPRHRRSTYGLSADTWTRGRKKLELYGILSVEREPFGSDFDYRRMRNAYKLDWELVKGAPPQIPR
jgi:hypothetical protein